jgi:hypothetical protein
MDQKENETTTMIQQTHEGVSIRLGPHTRIIRLGPATVVIAEPDDDTKISALGG